MATAPPINPGGQSEPARRVRRGGASLAGGVGRITGTVVGTIILGVMTSGFTFLRIDAYYQEIVKGIIIVAAVIIDQYRQRRRRTA